VMQVQPEFVAMKNKDRIGFVLTCVPHALLLLRANNSARQQNNGEKSKSQYFHGPIIVVDGVLCKRSRYEFLTTFEKKLSIPRINREVP